MNEIFELKYDIADLFKDIQMQANALKDPDDYVKSTMLLTKIADDITEIRSKYDEIELAEQ